MSSNVSQWSCQCLSCKKSKDHPYFSCRVDVSPTDVSPTENSWMLFPGTKRPLDIVSLTDVSRPWTASSMQLAPSAAIAASVCLRRLMDQWGVWPASPTPLTRFIGLASLRRMHARPTHRIKSKGWDGSVRGKIAKGHFVQGMQYPRIFGRGHIGRGWTNIAPYFSTPPFPIPILCFTYDWVSLLP